MDYEAQYQLTTDYTRQTLDRFRDVADIYHICVPFKVTTCTSMFQSYWRPWEPTLQYIWVRPIPEGAMTADMFPFYKENQWDYDFQREFGEWLCREKGRVCCLVGIRADESLNRWRTAYAESDNRRNYKGRRWTTQQGECVNAYPIIDWHLEDVWTANAREGWQYNHLYDLMYLAGVPLHKMRVASPFLSEGQETLRLYQVIEPDTWGRLVGRVNGVNFAGLYGGTTAMGWKNITKPAHFTWKQYMYFLLDTLPEETRQGYLQKLAVSMKFWRERGGCLSDEVIEELKAAGADIEVLQDTNYKTDKKPVRMDYLDDIDITAFKEIPTYKRMCICIIKNDHLCKYMGFALTKDEMNRRKAIQQKYADL
jgi:predicted phosphoadenosine phosphosulfate sulfurtransferase